jgi:hypothetical protein
MNITEIIPWLVLGFVPTLISMEAAWRMGKIIGKRGEKNTITIKENWGDKSMIMMTLVDIVSVIVGSGIIMTIIGLIAVDGLRSKKENKRIMTVNKEWQKIKVVAR